MASTKHRKKTARTSKVQITNVANPPFIQAKILRPTMNARMQVTIVPILPPGDPRYKTTYSPDGGPGIYRVTFVFSVPGHQVFRDQLDFRKIMQSGDSLLQAPSDIQDFKATLSTKDGLVDILLKTNFQRILSTAQINLHAQNFRDAERVAFNLISPELSYWSFLHDVALDIAGYEVVEESTDNRRYSFGVVGKIKTFDQGYAFQSIPEYRRFFATYREAMNATNVFYQALSFYKVAEGVKALRKRNSRRNKTAVLIYPNECIPENIDDPLILSESTGELTRESFQPYLGLDFDSVLERLKETIRNAIAHLG